MSLLREHAIELVLERTTMLNELCSQSLMRRQDAVEYQAQQVIAEHSAHDLPTTETPDALRWPRRVVLEGLPCQTSGAQEHGRWTTRHIVACECKEPEQDREAKHQGKRASARGWSVRYLLPFPGVVVSRLTGLQTRTWV